VPTVEKFPRCQKFLLADRVQATALDVLERLVEATYTKGRSRLLAQANLGGEKLRFLCWLAMDRRYLDLRRYEHAALSLDEIGRRSAKLVLVRVPADLPTDAHSAVWMSEHGCERQAIALLAE
jgi:hypothetical protein